MKLARASSKLGLLALAVSACPFVMAADPGWYGGVSAGQSRATIDDVKITSGLLGSGLATSSIDDKKEDTGYKLFGGYQFNRNFSLEGGYYNLGKFGFTAITVPAGTLKGDIKLQGINLDAVGILPFTEKFSGFGRVGVIYNEAKDSFSGTGAVNVLDPSPSKLDTNYKFGLGLQYDFTQKIAMRVEAERYRINDAVGNQGDVDLVSVGLIFRFGGKTPEAAPYTPPPAPVAVAAAPAPMVVAPVPLLPPPARAITRIAISVDSDFDFDKDQLNAGGKKVLDDFVKDIRGMKYDHIIVRGNTDRLGTEAYNMRLSVRRAETVRDYLIGAGGIAAVKLDTSGVGESQPDTRSAECNNMKDRKALVNCLQPDRRVDIELIGTK
jgi:OOP family OmpA-OmpF porin